MTSSNGNIFRVTGPLWRGFHRSPVDSPLKGQWRGALVFSLIYAWTNGWANNRDAGDLRRHHAHYDVTVMRGEPDTERTKARQLATCPGLLKKIEQRNICQIARQCASVKGKYDFIFRSSYVSTSITWFYRPFFTCFPLPTRQDMTAC